MMDRLANMATWDNTRDGMSHVFHRFALPIIWDFGEANPFSDAGGGFNQQIDWVTRYIEHDRRDAPGRTDLKAKCFQRDERPPD